MHSPAEKGQDLARNISGRPTTPSRFFCLSPKTLSLSVTLFFILKRQKAWTKIQRWRKGIPKPTQGNIIFLESSNVDNVSPCNDATKSGSLTRNDTTIRKVPMPIFQSRSLVLFPVSFREVYSRIFYFREKQKGGTARRKTSSALISLSRPSAQQHGMMRHDSIRDGVRHYPSIAAVCDSRFRWCYLRYSVGLSSGYIQRAGRQHRRACRDLRTRRTRLRALDPETQPNWHWNYREMREDSAPGI